MDFRSEYQMDGEIDYSENPGVHSPDNNIKR